ncbi:MAG: DNA integrity scanning diadenylate cyclase DisA [Nanoarchaeota archaeon]|nr:DNA integrity scanning diadenylate cyclase DisA [Nanoarchaeota archaeon]
MGIEKQEKETLFSSLSDSISEEAKLEKDFVDVLKMVAPGTSLRIALNDLLRAKMGALIVFDNGKLSSIVEGGFKINVKFSSQKLVELCKMDGGIVLSSDGKEILFANALLVPDSSIYTKETGTRHKAAERTAKQANTVVLAVSERKNKISVFCGEIYSQLERSSEILRKTSETLQILEKQRDFFNELLDNLNSLELQKNSNMNDVCLVLQRAEIMKRIAKTVERSLIELGRDGVIVRMRLKELMGNLKKEENLILRDYFGSSYEGSVEILKNMDFDFLLEPMNVLRMLFEELHDKPISPKGIRLLKKTNILERYGDLLVGNFKNLKKILSATNKQLLEVLESEAMVAFFREEIYNLKEKISLGRRI